MPPSTYSWDPFVFVHLMLDCGDYNEITEVSLSLMIVKSISYLKQWISLKIETIYNLISFLSTKTLFSHLYSYLHNFFQIRLIIHVIFWHGTEKQLYQKFCIVKVEMVVKLSLAQVLLWKSLKRPKAWKRRN